MTISGTNLYQNNTIYLSQSSPNSELISYAAFERPLFAFRVDSAETDGTAGCSFSSSADDRTYSTFGNLTVCFTEVEPCNSWIGNNGWLYWGPSNRKVFGVQLSPSWSWAGTRRYVQLTSSNFLDVRPSLINSSHPAFEPLNFTSRPPFEFQTIDMQGAGLMRFYAGRDGALQRYVLCANFTVGTGATFAVDMQSIFQWQTARSLFNSVTSLWEFRYNRIVVATQSSSAIASNTFRLELANQPPGFTLESFEFAWDWRQRALSLNFALRDANHTRAPGVTTTTTLATPAPTQPSFSCQRNCNGQGTCIDTDVCQCFVGFVPDPNTGCVSADLIHAVTMTDATSTSNQSTVAIPESVSVRSVSSDSFAGISLEILIGAVIGAVLGTVLIVVVVIFVVRSCKKEEREQPEPVDFRTVPATPMYERAPSFRTSEYSAAPAATGFDSINYASEMQSARFDRNSNYVQSGRFERTSTYSALNANEI
jgi:hypothetical protein